MDKSNKVKEEMTTKLGNCNLCNSFLKYTNEKHDGKCVECAMRYAFICTRCKNDRLKEILDTMDIPENRKTDFPWLLRNMFVRNSNHVDIEEATKLVKIELKRWANKLDDM